MLWCGPGRFLHQSPLMDLSDGQPTAPSGKGLETSTSVDQDIKQAVEKAPHGTNHQTVLNFKASRTQTKTLYLMPVNSNSTFT